MLTKTMWETVIDVVKYDKQCFGNENIISNFVGIFALLGLTPIFLATDILLLPIEIIYHFIK